MSRDKSSEPVKKKKRNVSCSLSNTIEYSDFAETQEEQGTKVNRSYPERLRKASESSHKHENAYIFTLRYFFRYIISSQICHFILFLGISMLINSWYFNLYYLPMLNEQRSSSGQHNSHFKKFNPNTKFFKNNLDHVYFASFNDDKPFEEKTEYLLINQDEESKQLLVTLEQIEAEDKKNEKLKKREKMQHEAQMALSLALNIQNEGKLDKAGKIYTHALSLDPENTDALVSYGEYLELYKKDVIKAEHFYTKVINMKPNHNKASLNLKRASPIVNKLDRLMLDKLDDLLRTFYEIPATSSALKRAKREAYFMHIYHSNAIEGNTLNLHQTRHILENRVAINGKSLIEHQEVLGLDSAMRYINRTLLSRNMYVLSIQEVLEIHRRVLGFCDPIESGKFRQHQVFVGNFVPPPPNQVENLMHEFIDWINSDLLLNEAHPIQIAALAHYKFVYIHPFYDGNGRTARILMNLILMKSGYPPIIIKKENRLKYYEYLEMANQGDVKPFIRFIARCAQITLEYYIILCDNAGISADNVNTIITNEMNNEYNKNSKCTDIKKSAIQRKKKARKKQEISISKSIQKASKSMSLKDYLTNF